MHERVFSTMAQSCSVIQQAQNPTNTLLLGLQNCIFLKKYKKGRTNFHCGNDIYIDQMHLGW